MEHRESLPGPLTIGELITRTASLYLQHFRTFIGIAAVLLIPVTALQIISGLAASGSDDPFANALLNLTLLVIWTLSAAGVFAGIIAATGLAVARGKTSILDAFDYGVQHVFALLKSLAIIVAALVALSITVVGIPAAIFLVLAWFVVGQTVVLEGLPARVALGRSWELTRHSRLRILGTLLVVGFVTGIAMVLFELPSVALDLRTLMRGEDDPAPTFAWIVADLFSLAGSILILPLQYCAWTLVYFDLLARNEQRRQVEPPITGFGIKPAAMQQMD
jgi:hypothetical protein